MAELLVRVVDKINEDFYLNCQCTKRGDVIVVCPDGWAWGREERRNPDWRILKMPGVSVSELSALLVPEPVSSKGTSNTLQRRAFKLDLDHPSLPMDLLACVADEARAEPIYDAKTFDLLALKGVKTVIEDPAIFGDDPGIF